jgi:carbon starvation protein
MFGIANQMLAAIALAIVSAYLTNEGRRKYLAVTILPMLVVMTTTTTAAVEQIILYINTIRTQAALPKPTPGLITNSVISAALTLAMLGSAYIVILAAMSRCFKSERQPVRGFEAVPAAV